MWKEWKEIAEKNGINRRNFYQRITKQGWDCKKAATVLLRKERNDRKLIELAKKNGIHEGTYKSRVDKLNWSPEKAATEKPKHRGKRHDREWIEIAKSNGVAYETYRCRVHDYFWPPEEAATTPAMSNEEITSLMRETYADYVKIKHERINNDPNNLFKLTKEHYEIALKNGICKSTVQGRVYQKGWTVQEAINTPVYGSTKSEEFKHYRKIAESNGINYSLYSSRIEKLGWSPEKAAVTQPIKHVPHPMLALALENGVPRKTFEARIRAGWDIEEAATTKPLPRGQFSSKGKEKNKIALAKMIGS